jgi:predicted dehydrogenase
MKIGFIGCGNIAHFHADVLIALDVNIIAVSARENSKKIGPFCEKYNITKHYSDWRIMIEKENLDALWVMTTWNQMDDLLLPLIETGLPLFLEKPIALSSVLIKKAIEVHKNTNQYIQVGFNRRFYPFMDEIKTIITSGELRSVLVEIPESTDLNDHDFATNLWLINSAHVIDLLMFHLGAIDIKYTSKSRTGKSNIASSFNAMLETEQGVPVHLSAEWNTSNNFGITFYVNNQRISLKPLEIATIYEGFDVIEPSIDIPVRQYKPMKYKEFFCDGEYKPGFFEQAKYFVNNVGSHKLLNKHADLQACLDSTILIEEMLCK